MTCPVIYPLHGGILEPNLRPGAHCIMQTRRKNLFVKTYAIYVVRTRKNGKKEI